MGRRWVVTAMVMAMTAGMFAGCGRPDPAETVKNLYFAIQVRKYDEVLDRYMTEEFREAATKDAETKANVLNSWDRVYANIARMKKFTIMDEQINGNRATVKFSVLFENGRVVSDQDNLVCEDGAWRVVM
jgi:hypothetical protein